MQIRHYFVSLPYQLSEYRTVYAYKLNCHTDIYEWYQTKKYCIGCWGQVSSKVTFESNFWLHGLFGVFDVLYWNSPLICHDGIGINSVDCSIRLSAGANDLGDCYLKIEFTKVKNILIGLNIISILQFLLAQPQLPLSPSLRHQTSPQKSLSSQSRWRHPDRPWTVSVGRPSKWEIFKR